MLINKLRRFMSKKFSPVNIDYTDLVSSKDLSSKIEEGFGQSALGILTVSGVPNLLEKREQTLTLASKLPHLRDLQSLEVPEVGYTVGWSHGKEKFEGQPDYSKGSFYANPETDKALDDSGTYADNVWPKQSLPELEPAFKGLGTLIIDVGRLLAKHIDKYLETFEGYEAGSMERMISGYKSHVGRLLHYFPQQGTSQPWCGWHNDHGTLTGLTCALYIDEDTGQSKFGNEIQDEKSGLFIRNRNGDVYKASVTKDLLMFQIGETAQIVSGGKLQATPHAVMVSGLLGNVSRNTLAVFMEPGPDYLLKCPDESKIDIEHEGVPSLKKRWKSGMTFGEFNLATIHSFYDHN